MGWSKNKESERPFFKRDMWYGFLKAITLSSIEDQFQGIGASNSA